MPVPEHVFAAARTGDIAVLREYFASGDRDPNDTVERTGWTLLDGACRGTRDEVAAVDWGGTPRVISCEVVSFLLSQGASVDYQPRRLQARALFLGVGPRLAVGLLGTREDSRDAPL